MVSFLVAKEKGNAETRRISIFPPNRLRLKTIKAVKSD